MPRPSPTLLRRVAAVALLFTAGLAQAQFVWVDPKGVRHYSDQPPPPGTPPARILKAPGLTMPAAQPVPVPRPAPAPDFSITTLDGPVAIPPAQAPAAPGAAAPAAAPPGSPAKPATKGPQTLAEKDADFRKRLKDSQEAEQKAQEQARTNAQKAEQCAEARKAKAMYDSGIRISDIGADGQKRYLNDAERAQRSARASTMASACN